MSKLHRYLISLALVLCVLVFCVQCQQNNRRRGDTQMQGNRNPFNKPHRKQQGQKQQHNSDKRKDKLNNNKKQQGQNGGHTFEQQSTPSKMDVKKMKFITKYVPGLGRVRGRVIKTQWSGKPISQFLDIPYGKPPSGDLRFKPSVSLGPWEDEILQAHKPHWGCPTIQYLDRYELIAEKLDVDLEDCLRLSISSKALSESYPVMVYIHGDFLYDGNSLEAAPGYLLEEDVVLVSVRYRLGPFGFLSTMTEEMPGNAAVTDVILALQWIQKYIYAFGGDPKRVTLFGQSGGAALINVLTMSPQVPENLFHRVIYQSGSALSPAFVTDNPIAATRDMARLAGCKNYNKIEAINKCMRKLNTTTILQAFNLHGDSKATLGVGTYGGVQFVVGGPSNILPEHPGKLLADNKFKAYPTMGGSVKNAGTFILKDIYVDNFNETIIDDKFDGPGYVKHIIKETNGADPTGAWMKFAEQELFLSEEMKNGSFYKLVPGLIDLCSTIPFKNPVLLALQANSRKLPNNTFLYTFNYEGEMNRYATNDDEEGAMPFELGVSLTDDNLYLFPWPRDTVLNANRDIKIAKRMVALWTSFAATGVPKAPGMPTWPPMSRESGPYLKIDKTVCVGNNYLDEYLVTVKEAQMGFNIVNDEFFESLVEIKENDVKTTTNNAILDEIKDSDTSEMSEDDEGDDFVQKSRSNKIVNIKKNYRIS